MDAHASICHTPSLYLTIWYQTLTVETAGVGGFTQQVIYLFGDQVS